MCTTSRFRWCSKVISEPAQNAFSKAQKGGYKLTDLCRCDTPFWPTFQGPIPTGRNASFLTDLCRHILRRTTILT